ncbi:hypothetical protein GC173_06655 [bacterium]|nr:hypothetical protein [bacterium]
MLDFLHSLHSSEGIAQIIQTGGVLAMTAIIFAETGLLVGFFLPGDSLLITAGVLANPANPNHLAALNVLTLNAILIVAAIVGDQLGFYLGYRSGNAIWNRPDGRFYKRRHMEEAHAFYEKWGGLAVVGARFVPILRTFVPFAAGVARMPYKNFVWWNIFGGIVWITSLLWAGYLLGGTKWADRLDKIIVIVVLVSVLPLVAGVAKRIFFGQKAAPSGGS